MKWLEIIELRSVDRDRVLNELDLMSLVAGLEPGLRPQEIKVYAHETVGTDISIHLLNHSEQVNTHGSSLGLHLASALKEFGLVNHNIWVETHSSS